MDQLFELDEVLRILLGVLREVGKDLVEGSSGLEDRYNIINIGKGSWPDGCFCRKRVGIVRHVCLGGLAVVVIEEYIPARAYGRLSYILKTPGMSTTPIMRRDSARLVKARRRKTLHIVDAPQIYLSYQTRRQEATDKATRRKMADQGRSD